MQRETAATRIRDAHRVRDALIEHGKVLSGCPNLNRGLDCPTEDAMKRFRRYAEEEVRRLNRLQADYFSENVQVFEPPLPEGVPERLRRIVHSAGIHVSDSVLDIGTGTGILIPLIQEYSPACIYANDLSEAMLETVKAHYPFAITKLGDAGDLALPAASIGVAFINACYSNLIDKHKTFTNLRRMFRPGGRLIISHPLGRSFVEVLKKNVPFPLDDFPADEPEAGELFARYGFRVSLFVDRAELYILRLESAA